MDKNSEEIGKDLTKVLIDMLIVNECTSAVFVVHCVLSTMEQMYRWVVPDGASLISPMLRYISIPTVADEPCQSFYKVPIVNQSSL